MSTESLTTFPTLLWQKVYTSGSMKEITQGTITYSNGHYHVDFITEVVKTGANFLFATFMQNLPTDM